MDKSKPLTKKQKAEAASILARAERARVKQEKIRKQNRLTILEGFFETGLIQGFNFNDVMYSPDEMYIAMKTITKEETKRRRDNKKHAEKYGNVK